MSQSAEKVSESIYRVADGAVNWYVVDDGTRLALVDTGWPRSWGRIEQVLGELGHAPADLDVILLTHGHPDHMGAAERARKETGAVIRAASGEVDRLRGEAPGSNPLTLVPSLIMQIWRPHTARFVAEATAKGFLFPTWVTNVEPFEPGGRVDAPGEPIAVATPGHTEGHVSFHFPGEGVLVAGDAIATTDPVTGSPGPRLAHDVVNADPEQTRRSLDAIAANEAELLLPGHGDPWRGKMADAAGQARALA